MKQQTPKDKIINKGLLFMDAGRLALPLMVFYFALYLIGSPISILFFWMGMITMFISLSCFAASGLMLHKLAKLKRNSEDDE